MEACQRQMYAGAHVTYESETYDVEADPWAYNTVLGCFVGTALFGVVTNGESTDAGMLQVRLAGTAPPMT